MRIAILGILMLAVTGAASAAPNIEMMLVKGGCYQMGDTFGDGDPNEKPAHKVCVDDFYMAKYLVTQDQWQEIMGTNPSTFKACGGNCPVEMITWGDAQEFIRKLNKQTGKNYRLPYEAEWEYAARSGGKQERWAGTSDPKQIGAYAWFKDNSGETTHPVGTQQPNGLGLYDMAGNVWEWCMDWYDEDYYKKSPEKTPHGPSDGSLRVARGGSWTSWPNYARATRRHPAPPAEPLNLTGFRLVLPVGKP